MDCDFSPSSPHLLPNGLFSPQNRISFELLALSGLSGFSTFKGGKMLIFQGFANSRIVREFPPFSFKVRIATLTRNQVVAQAARGFESHPIRHDHASSRFFRLLAFLFAQMKPPANISRAQTPHHRPPLRYIQRGRCACAQKTNAAGVCRPRSERMVSVFWSDFGSVSSGEEAVVLSGNIRKRTKGG